MYRFAQVLVTAVAITQVPLGQTQEAGPTPWIGIGYAVDAETPEVRVVSLPYRSPAEDAGVLLNDVIVGMDGSDFDVAASDLGTVFRESIAEREVGDRVVLRVVRGGETPIDITVEIGERPAGIGGIKEFSSFEDVRNAFPTAIQTGEALAHSLIEAFGIEDDYEDLLSRLARLSDRGDLFRLSRVAYIQNEPFQLQTVGEKTFDEIRTAMTRWEPQSIVRSAAQWLDAGTQTPTPLETGLSLEAHLEQLTRLLSRIAASREAAFSGLSVDDRQYVEDNLDDLFTTFADQIDIQADPDRERWKQNARVLELVEQVDLVKLAEGAALLSSVTDDSYLEELELAVRTAWEAAGSPEGIFINRASPIGQIILGGTGSTWYDQNAAILLDLDGKDFYTNNAGSPRADDMPAALLIDFAGDDAYEATLDWTQSAARMGYGLLIDRDGNDNYVGQDWAQGAAVLGASLFIDEAGDDVYRSRQYAQGAAAWGMALHIDREGDDRYDAGQLAQGLGMAGGAGWLLNAEGNDTYYAKGLRPTAYGDPGIFDSWSQGSGVGFRGLHSGGAAILYDGGGRDRYEAGNFSQGGGYYFGVGFLHDHGADDDTYIGSRYNQGFAAHQAIGYFNESGGNDYYTARHAVAQGIAWDEAIVLFIDRAGDDVYEGAQSFSQGASAHNGFCVFLDLGGYNRFDYSIAQASAGPNDYHGGTSFSLFVAANGDDNVYDSGMDPFSIRLSGEHGVFVDLPGSIDEAIDSEIWLDLIDSSR